MFPCPAQQALLPAPWISVKPGQSREGPMSALAALPGRDLLAFLAGLGQADRDRLLPARHLLAAPAALQRALLALVHGTLDVLGCAPGFLGHSCNPRIHLRHQLIAERDTKVPSGGRGAENKTEDARIKPEAGLNETFPRTVRGWDSRLR